MATEALREVSAIGKEMIDGNSAVAAVASSIVMDSNVFPSRNSTRDKETTKEVVDAINKYGLIPAAGQAEVWKGQLLPRVQSRPGPCSGQVGNLQGLHRQLD